MKKTILFVAIILLSTTTFSQTKTRFGLRVGANFSKLVNLDTKTKLDFYLGGLVSIKFSESYTLQPEIIYSKQGSILLENERIIRVENAGLKDININFLSLAIMNKISMSSIDFLIGPFIDFKLDDNINRDINILDVLFVIPNRMDFGIIAGVSYDVSKSISIEARFKRGFLNVVNESDIYEGIIDNDGSSYNQIIQLGIVYKFDFKK